jgi:SAM-dependent methyltransferase
LPCFDFLIILGSLVLLLVIAFILGSLRHNMIKITVGLHDMRRRFVLGALALAGVGGATLYFAPRQPDVMYAQTEMGAVARMLALAGATDKDIIYDLGCGDGRFVIAAARQFGTRGVGIDIDPARVKEASALALQAGVADRVRFVEADLFKADITEATIVALYLAPQLNLKLRPKLMKELRPGTRIVSYSFDMGDWQPEKTERVGSTPIYLWRVPKHNGGVA